MNPALTVRATQTVAVLDSLVTPGMPVLMVVPMLMVAVVVIVVTLLLVMTLALELALARKMLMLVLAQEKVLVLA